MTALVRKGDTTGDAWTIGAWDERHTDDAPLAFHDRAETAVWLRGFAVEDLRRVVFRYSDSSALSRLTDQEVAERLAGLIVSGDLRVSRAGKEDDRDARRSDPGAGPEASILRRLRVTADEFPFEGNRLRIIPATRWESLRASDATRYQLVPSEAAQALLKKMAELPAISTDERRALGEAVPLVADTRRTSMQSGILLVRVLTRWGTPEETGREPASTPSQLAGRPKDKLFWIQIELVDAAGRPVPNEPYRLELPDGELRQGKLDADGRARVDDIKVAGQCRVSFPEIDAKEWRAA